eukprot:CAMPEP_0116907940 /NCGR_PEP_ID=MMETSP0467-20121206/13398_1 /TAXON_ID=283647 /ORGANISM="Mesodinium pulex, Strain SPMC105" /LENGTH=74 /DNA_ID=CAMNT_0004583041 /DNA_START=976 /DNA_END=1200 /DNA_ORIENTATION=-
MDSEYSKLLSDFLDFPGNSNKTEINNEMRNISFPINNKYLHEGKDPMLVKILKHRLDLIVHNELRWSNTEWDAD